jgi:chitodextrinase
MKIDYIHVYQKSTAPPDTTPPTVSLTAPTANATVSGASVTVSANATDAVGVSGVQFKLDGANLGSEDTSSPYSTTWNTTTATNGTHTLTAVARDAAGNSTTATTVSVTVNNVSTTTQSPFGGTPRAIPGTIQAEDFDNGGEGISYHDTTAGNTPNQYRTDTDVDIEKDQDTDNGYNLGYVASGEWTEYTLNTTAGLYNLSARVASGTGGTLTVKLDGTTIATFNVPNTGGWYTWSNQTASSVSLPGGTNKVLRIEFSGGAVNTNSLTFTAVAPPDTTPPTITLTAPAPNATVSGKSVVVSANASDNVGVAGVQFQLDGNSLGAEDTTAPYSYTWDTTTLGNGTYNLNAIARDAAGNVQGVKFVPVTVNNVTTPPPDTTAPSTPSNLTSSGKTTSTVSLAWGASSDTGGSGLAGYKIYRNNNFVASTTQLTYTDTNLNANTAYSYKVASYDNAGNTSAQTSALSVTTSSNSTPPPDSTPKADFNSDNIVNIFDFSIFLSHYGTSYTPCDLNTDGTVNILDFSIFLTKWGTSG